jgi:hypothetical protein
MLTYEDTRPWGLAMEQMVVTRAMPPWFEENPDPDKTVTWGQQSSDEMMVCFFNVAFPADTPAKELLPLPTNETASRTQ